MVRAIKAKLTNEKIEAPVDRYLRIRCIKDAIYELDDMRRVLDLFDMFEKYELRFCMRKNILFVDPVESTIRPLSRFGSVGDTSDTVTFFK